MDLKEKILKLLYEKGSLNLNELEKNLCKDEKNKYTIKQIKEAVKSISEIKLDINRKYHIAIDKEELFFYDIKNKLNTSIKIQVITSIKFFYFWIVSLFLLMGLVFLNPYFALLPFVSFYINCLIKYKYSIIKLISFQFLIYIILKEYFFSFIYGDIQVYNYLYFDIFSFSLSFIVCYLFFYKNNIINIFNILLLFLSPFIFIIYLFSSISFYSISIYLKKSKKALKLFFEDSSYLIGTIFISVYFTYSYFYEIKNMSDFYINHFVIAIISIIFISFFLFIFRRKYFIYKIFKNLCKMLSIYNFTISSFKNTIPENKNKNINKKNRNFKFIRQIILKIKQISFINGVKLFSNEEENKHSYYILGFCLAFSFCILIGLIQNKGLYKYIYYPFFVEKNNETCANLSQETLIIRLKDGQYYIKENDNKNDFNYQKIEKCIKETKI